MKLARLGEGPEIFCSLQGEGKNVGAPSVFVRLSRCNLYCRWCDTPYTWNWSTTTFTHEGGRKFEAAEQTIELDVAEVVRSVQRWPCRRVVLTGGEPLLQARDCARLAAALCAADPAYVFEVETNGTLVPPPELDALLSQYTVSTKLSSSGVEESLRLRPEALTFFARSAKSVFKLVVGSAEEVAEAAALVGQHGVAPDRVWLMPQASSAAALDALGPLVAASCLEHGFRFSDRLHIRLFGNRPGV